MKNLLIFTTVLLLISACKKDELSGDASILSFTVSDVNPSGLTVDEVILDEANKRISVLFDENLQSESFPLSLTASYTVNSGVLAMPASGEQISFSNIDDWEDYTLKAENGNIIEYALVLRDNQIPNSGFEDWYNATGLNAAVYKEPGKSALTTVWATANNGTSIYGVYCTTPVIDVDNTVAQIITGETLTVPITAGTLFTGKFDTDAAISNPTNTRKAVLFGIPFSLRPTAMKFRYTYQAGARYIKATLNNPTNIFGGFTIEDLEGEDMFYAYAILEVRNGDQVTEIGRAELASGVAQTDFIEVTLPFSYTSTAKPTHISVVFSSSKDGEFWTGAVGSVLTIDDLELIY